MFSLLVKIRLLSIWNIARYSVKRHKILAACLTAAGSAIFSLIFFGFFVFLQLVRTDEETAELVYEIFYFLFLFLLAGAVPFVASTLFHSSDYLLLSAAPVQPRAIVAAKLLDATVTNSLQFTVIGIPAISACALALGVGAAGWALIPLVVMLFVLLPALITALLLLVALAVFGMKRVRSAITVVNVIMAAVVCLTIVSQTGRLRIHSGFQQEFIQTPGVLRTAHISPSGPFAYSLVELGKGHLSQGLRELGWLTLLNGLLFLACMQWGGRLLTAQNLAQEDDGQQALGASRGELQAHRNGLLVLFSSPVAAIIAKDFRYVLRDSVLLSQLGMPVILFCVPFVLALQQDTGRVVTSGSDIYPFAAAMTGVIVFMQTSIISLSAIGLENRGFWLMLTSPNAGRTLLWAKFVLSTLISGGVGIALTLLSAALFHATPMAALVQAGYIVLTSSALCGMGVGISAALPRFVYENPAHRVSTWALILGFVSTMGYMMVAGILSALTWHTATILTDRATLVYAIGGSMLLIITFLAIIIPMTIGAKRIEVYQWEH